MSDRLIEDDVLVTAPEIRVKFYCIELASGPDTAVVIQDGKIVATIENIVD